MSDKIAMQVRCVHCRREQWAIVVLSVSRGDGRCAWCGKTSKPMTDAEYREAMMAAEAKKEQSETNAR